MRGLRSALFAVLLASGCATVDGHHVFSLGEATQGDPRIGQYRSSQWSLQTASYWIVGPEGLVLIDAQLLESAVIKQNRFAEAKSGLRPVAAIVLHASPDRFNGTRYLKESGIPVWTAASVRDEIPSSHAQWWPRLAEKYRAARYPRELVLPDSFGASSRTLAFAGLTLTAHVLGPGTSPSHVVLGWEDHLFVGNLISHGVHAWYEGRSLEEWLARLEELKAMRSRFPALAYEELLTISVRHAYGQRTAVPGPRGDAATKQRAYYETSETTAVATKDDIFSEALHLPHQERAELAHKLLSSLDEDGETSEGLAEDAWAVEVERRAQQVVDGTAKTRPWSEVKERLSAGLRRRK